MDERELRAAMDQAVAVAPPPMSDEPVLVAGRQALKRRRAVRASAGSAAMVAVVAVGVAVLAPSQGQGDVPVGGQLPPVQETADQHQDRGAKLAAALDNLAPAGYGTPDDLKGVDDYANRTLKTHSAMSVGVINGTEVWYYAAGTPLTKGEGVGELVAAVYSRGWETTGEGCGLTPTAWDAAVARCTDVDIDGKKVAVADIPARDGLPPAQWAGYRHADGTEVFVMQTTQVVRSGRPALDAMPMTGRQLATVAVDARLKPW